MAVVSITPRTSSNALGAGLTFGAVIALFACGGLWLDRRWGTEPWLLLAGILLGLLGGTIHLLASVAPGVLPFGKRPKASPPRPPTPRGPAARDQDQPPPTE
jgi:F0F1-type ATP synthase assembly protein I